MKKKFKKYFSIIVFVFILLMYFKIATSSNLGKRKVETYSINVSSNDTLWNIASDICKDNENLNIQNVILEIKDINNMTESVIYKGQTLNIPVY